jgi:hypothetical protein
LNELGEIVVELGKDLERLDYAGKTITVKYKVRYDSNQLTQLATYL